MKESEKLEREKEKLEARIRKAKQKEAQEARRQVRFKALL